MLEQTAACYQVFLHCLRISQYFWLETPETHLPYLRSNLKCVDVFELFFLICGHRGVKRYLRQQFFDKHTYEKNLYYNNYEYQVRKLKNHVFMFCFFLYWE